MFFWARAFEIELTVGCVFSDTLMLFVPQATFCVKFWLHNIMRVSLKKTQLILFRRLSPKKTPKNIVILSVDDFP